MHSSHILDTPQQSLQPQPYAYQVTKPIPLHAGWNTNSNKENTASHPQPNTRNTHQHKSIKPHPTQPSLCSASLLASYAPSTLTEPQHNSILTLEQQFDALNKLQFEDVEQSIWTEQQQQLQQNDVTVVRKKMEEKKKLTRVLNYGLHERKFPALPALTTPAPPSTLPLASTHIVSVQKKNRVPKQVDQQHLDTITAERAATLNAYDSTIHEPQYRPPSTFPYTPTVTYGYDELEEAEMRGRWKKYKDAVDED